MIKTMTLKARGEHGAGKSELLAMVARLAVEAGMEACVDADHKLTIISSGPQRLRLWTLNRRCVCATDKDARADRIEEKRA